MIDKTTADEIVVAILSGAAIVHYTRCQACICGQHMRPPEPHRWADADDIKHAKVTSQPEPTGLCACPCAHGKEVASDEEPDGEPDLDESLDAQPCPVCGSVGACSTDGAGWALIHVLPREDA